MTTWIFTATSRTGQPVDPITKASTDSVAVYSQADLDRRIEAAKNDPRDLIVDIERID
ncbi:hypothetical protein [Streptomyces sp. NPDC058108]|uniref:hypothetical protein n=1 Tax=Streptomyces sp. NPDC058108 TaxID=3346344 RepID=UPI0036EF3FBF